MFRKDAIASCYISYGLDVVTFKNCQIKKWDSVITESIYPMITKYKAVTCPVDLIYNETDFI